MKQFMRGREWWMHRDDGSWHRWNREPLAWDPQPDPPPADGLTEITAPGPRDDPGPVESQPTEDWRKRRRLAYQDLARSFDNAATVMFIILLIVLAVAGYFVFQLIDIFWDIG